LLRNANPRHTIPPHGSMGPQILQQTLARHPLDLPGIGRVGERRPFDPIRLEISHATDGWHLSAGPHELGPLGNNKYQARTAMQIAQRYPLTEHVRIGTGDFTFYLSNGAAPRGVPLGVRSTAFQPKMLTVKQTGNQWVV